MIPGIDVTGNNKVWRKFTFSPLITTKIKLEVSASPNQTWAHSRVVELEAFGTNPVEQSSTAETSNVHWLVADQLGTPRMIIDRTGSLSGVIRRDYLPFGEEIPSNVGRRSEVSGYSIGNEVRQKFTSKERDAETGLDYFLARYYSSTQGRFSSPDEFTGGPAELYYFATDASSNPTFYADLGIPQSLNKYQYAFNNPLRFVDGDGHISGDPCSCTGPTDQTIVDNFFWVLDTVADATKITSVAEGIRQNAPKLLTGAKNVLEKLGQTQTLPCNECASWTYNSEDAAKKVPNPNGQNGKQDHQDEVARQADKARAEAGPGEAVLVNKKIRGVDSNRLPDVQTVDANGRVTKVVEVERRPNSKRNREREREYNEKGVPFETVGIPGINIKLRVYDVPDLLKK